jgi:16S rRNA (cytidine1402-2'-O)-methyltransferase
MFRQTNDPGEKGILYIVGTPIGNLADISERARHVLAEADVIAAEDTRHTRKLLNHLDISTPSVSYHEHNRLSRTAELAERLEKGERIVLVSDAGMPGISDPGEDLIREAVQREIPVIPIPGPNAALSALVGSGLPPQPFAFIGFLPRQQKARVRELEKWRLTPATLIFYEAPHRVLAMLKDVESTLGDRQAAVARELTKKHEEWLRGKVSECRRWLEEHRPRGEFTIVVSGASEEEIREQKTEESDWWESLSLKEHVEHYIERGHRKKEAIQQAAKDRDVPKREVYNAYHRGDEE